MRREESPERGETVASSDPAGTRACADPNPSRIDGRRPRSAKVVFDTFAKQGAGTRVGAGGREGRVWKREDRERPNRSVFFGPPPIRSNRESN